MQNYIPSQNKGIDFQFQYPDPIKDRCVPKRGELIVNGGFEDSMTFFGWQIDPNNDGVNQADADEVHSGVKAARLGFTNIADKLNGNGVLFQEVSGICHSHFYELKFEMNGEIQKGNAPVDARVIWLDEDKNVLGIGLHIIVTGASLPDDRIGVWTTFQGITDNAPIGAKFARIRFEIHAANPDTQHVHLDDVSFALIN